MLEGREDLFESKVLQIDTRANGGQTDEQERVLVIARDPGSANALVPVIEVLQTNKGVSLMAITDGRAQEILQRNFPTTDRTPVDGFLAADTVIGTPQAILANSSTSEIGLETYAAATYVETPMVLVEDYYTSAIPYLQALVERGLRLPDKVCVLDEAARQLIVDRLPQLADQIEVTGQPAFDRFALEDTESIGATTRAALRLRPEQKLVSFMSSFVTMDEIPRQAIDNLADQLHQTGHEVVLAFRQHPRDNVPYVEYERLFAAVGVTTVDTRAFSTDQIGAASDLIITTWSTEGLHGIYRRKPTIHLTDTSIMELPAGLTLPLPPVRLGASVGIDDVRQLSHSVNTLLDPESEAVGALRSQMERWYPADGKNAERVARAVHQVISEKPKR